MYYAYSLLYIITGGIKMNEFYPEGKLINTLENTNALANQNSLAEASYLGKILEARAIVCDSKHNLVVDLGCMRGIIPREEGAIGIKEGTVRDIAIISRVNRPVCFVVTGFEKNKDGSTVAMLSRRLAQEQCIENYINKLIPGDIINAKITYLETFGAFADIGCGIASLMPIDMISVSRIDHPRERFHVGMDIKAVVKTKEGTRISLSQKELLGTWEENASMFTPSETVAGIIRSVEDYGAFVELTPNLSGLAEFKEGIYPRQQASVYIKSIIPGRMKIKLLIIDTFDSEYRPSTPNYFIESGHIDRFLYSPKNCSKVIETIF